MNTHCGRLTKTIRLLNWKVNTNIGQMIKIFCLAGDRQPRRRFTAIACRSGGVTGQGFARIDQTFDPKNPWGNSFYDVCA
jgi:hypothetical protein